MCRCPTVYNAPVPVTKRSREAVAGKDPARAVEVSQKRVRSAGGPHTRPSTALAACLFPIASSQSFRAEATPEDAALASASVAADGGATPCASLRRVEGLGEQRALHVALEAGALNDAAVARPLQDMGAETGPGNVGSEGGGFEEGVSGLFGRTWEELLGDFGAEEGCTEGPQFDEEQDKVIAGLCLEELLHSLGGSDADVEVAMDGPQSLAEESCIYGSCTEVFSQEGDVESTCGRAANGEGRTRVQLRGEQVWNRAIASMCLRDLEHGSQGEVSDGNVLEGDGATIVSGSNGGEEPAAGVDDNFKGSD